MPRTRRREDADTVQAVSRALTILEALAGEPSSAMALTDLAHKVGLKMTTVHRLLSTLLTHGFAEQDQGTMRYRLGIKAFEIGNAALNAMDIRQVARPFLKELVDQLNETANLAILDRGEVVYIDQIESTNIVIVKMFARVGSRGPAHCTGSGKVLLAGLADEDLLPLLEKMPLARFTDRTITEPGRLLEELRVIRRQGYAVDDGERDEGVCCVAAPVFNYEQKAIAAVSVSGPMTRLQGPIIKERFVPTVQHIAAQISVRLGYHQR